MIGLVHARGCLTLILCQVPDDFSQLQQEFPTLVVESAAARPGSQIFILIDAVNQLQDVDSARRLDWLPASFPHNVHVVVSCTPGQSAGECLCAFAPELLHFYRFAVCML
jgi:hypothetical protein